MSVLAFPIKAIVWGVFSDSMRTFLNSRRGEKDVFNTWNDTENFILNQYGAIAKVNQGLYAKPKRVYAYKEMTPEDV
jgi:hypothetical protein